MAAGDFRLVSGRGSTVLMPITTTAINEGEMIEVGTTAKIADGDVAAGVIGVAAADGPANGTVAVYTDGVFDGTATTGVDFAIGDLVYSIAGKLFAGTTGDIPCGMVVESNPASAGTVRFALISAASTNTTAKA